MDFLHIAAGERGEEGGKEDLPALRAQVRAANRLRPSFVAVSGAVSPDGRAVLAKLSETVPCVLADGGGFYTFYCGGVHGIVIVGKLLTCPEADMARATEQVSFLTQELEQSKMCQHHTFIFCDVDPRLLPESFCEKVASSRVCAILGPAADGVAFDLPFTAAPDARPVTPRPASAAGDVVGGEREGAAEPRFIDDCESSEDEDVDEEGGGTTQIKVDEGAFVRLVAKAGASAIRCEDDRTWIMKDMVDRE